MFKKIFFLSPNNFELSFFQNLGIPVYLGGMARGLLGAQANLQLRHERKEALREADLVILAGSHPNHGNCYSILRLCRCCV